MYKVLDVCKYVVYYSNSKSYGISNLRLQKILYFIQAYFFRIKHTPCFSDEIEAWDFGPVVPCAYHEYKQFGAGEIPDYRKPDKEIIKGKDADIIRGVVDLLSEYSTTQLVEITHKQFPWRRNYVPYANNIISKHDIERFAKG